MKYQLFPLGDAAVTIELSETINVETQKLVSVITSYLDNHPFPGMIEYVPAFTTVSIFYDPMQVLSSERRAFRASKQSEKLPYDLVCEWIDTNLASLEVTEEQAPRTVKIPVCYGGDFGPDLAFVAEHNGLTKEDVINIHSNGDYLVYMIGFAPGFPYIGGMSEKIAAPRRESPRLAIPAGSVAIAGKQTGVYPIETPGGWQIIGRTPSKLFRPDDKSPSLLQAGDTIEFVPISEKEYTNWKEGEHER